jgi:GTP-binding protein HflX
VAETHLDELAALAETAGAVLEGRLLQRRQSIHPSTFLSRGKLSELQAAIERTSADLVIFDEDLTPVQAKNLEKKLEIKILDRSELILDIFSRHARTREAMTQVELAQLEYMLPRLSGMWEHLSRLGGGIGTKGPGETQLEVDRRHVRRKISVLKKRLEAIGRERDTQTRRRDGSFRICFVGYTNAGKSTLFNALTDAGVLAEDKLFATLETTTRRLRLPGGPVALLSDTVGFLKKLPHHLVASFRATLREVEESDLLLHVADGSHPDLEEQMAAVASVLEDLLDHPVAQLLILNKIDRIDDEVRLQSLPVRFSESLPICAFEPRDIARLRDTIAAHVRARRRRVRVLYGYAQQGRVRRLLERGQRVAQRYLDEAIEEDVWLAPEDVDRLVLEGLTVETAGDGDGSAVRG